MGYAKLATKNIVQLQRLIHQQAKDTANVVLTEHAKQQMLRRKIGTPSLHTCLRLGAIQRQPESSDAHGTLNCRIERKCSGQNIGVVVALSDDDPTLIIVTAMIVSSRK